MRTKLQPEQVQGKDEMKFTLGPRLLIAILFSMLLMACSKDKDPDQPQGSGTVKGSVKDEQGNLYPNTVVKLTKGSDRSQVATNADGNYEKMTNDIGTYEVNLVPPLSSEVVTPNPSSANVMADKTVTVDFVIKPKPIHSVLSLGVADIFNEIRDKDGNAPTDLNEPLYAANFFQAPIGLLTAIKAPDGHHVTLSEFSKAKGTYKVHCNGATSTVEIALEGMIPNGIYTTWLGYLKTVKKVGDPISFSDFVYAINPPLGDPNGADNVLQADAQGKINVTISHNSCILTDEVALGMPISYHLNGNTYGAGEIPDVEEVTQLLIYFQ